MFLGDVLYFPRAGHFFHQLYHTMVACVCVGRAAPGNSLGNFPVLAWGVQHQAAHPPPNPTLPCQTAKGRWHKNAYGH